MGAVFAKVASSIITAEGGYSNSSTDYGGETKYGISKREFPHADIPNLTEAQALALLEEFYWQKYRLSEINDQSVANQVFFLFVNMNPIKAAKIVQLAINGCGRGIINIKCDGILGSQSIEAINSLIAGWLSDRIRVEAIRYYLQLTDEDKSQIVNFRGWIRREVT